MRKGIEERDEKIERRKILKYKLEEEYIFVKKGNIFSICVLNGWIETFMIFYSVI